MSTPSTTSGLCRDGPEEDPRAAMIQNQLENSAISEIANNNIVSGLPGAGGLTPAQRSSLAEQHKRRLAGRLLS